MDHQQQRVESLLKVVKMLTTLVLILLAAMLLMLVALFYGERLVNAFKNEVSIRTHSVTPRDNQPQEVFWSAPEISGISDVQLKGQIEYGKALVAHTAKYLGPKGLVMQVSNGMNCQNCHLDAGTRIFGNNYSAVASTYPKFRARSGKVEDVYKRVNDCFERSLNGKPLDTLSREMQAIKAYINFVGSNVPKDEKPDGAGFKELAYLDREADPLRGKAVYEAKCLSCHQADGQGQFAPDGLEYTYPPLWGTHSYNDGAGLYRVSNFARYVKNNMPLGVTHRNPLLTDEEAWDVAAFVNSQNRPHISTQKDWPDITKKPVDHPFGPYADTFSEKQHKYGLFKPILEASKNSSPTVLK